MSPNKWTCGSDAQNGTRHGDIDLAVIILAGAADYTWQTPTKTGISKKEMFWVI